MALRSLGEGTRSESAQDQTAPRVCSVSRSPCYGGIRERSRACVYKGAGETQLKLPSLVTGAILLRRYIEHRATLFRVSGMWVRESEI